MISGKSIYTLKELDSMIQIGTVTGNRIKHLYQQQDNSTEMYDAPPIVNNTLSIVKNVIHQEEDEDQGSIFPEGEDDPDAIDIN